MPITYRYHRDTRDGKIYPCVLMPDGKWWSAKNLAWAGAGRYYNDDLALGAIYGRLYSWDEALVSCPPGSHLPGDAEWTTLETAIPDPDGTKLKANSTLWVPNTGTDDYGFCALPGGFFNRTSFYYVGNLGDWWSATEYDYSLAWDRSMKSNYANVYRYGDYKTNRFSVRFIIDVFNEPIPPTKIKGTFSGSGVKVFCTNYNTPTFELPLSAQTTTELTIKKDFIATWGAALGNVRILVVDGEYISDWKDWNFNA